MNSQKIKLSIFSYIYETMTLLKEPKNAAEIKNILDILYQLEINQPIKLIKTKFDI